MTSDLGNAPTGARPFRGWIYDRLVAGMTSDWYRAVLDRLPDGARVLDVGIGTGSALARCADLVHIKRLQVLGLDIDPDYLQRCRAELLRAGLSAQVRAEFSSVYDHRGGPYDAVYFSASLMLLPDPAAAIAHVAQLLTPEGRLFATQTFHHRRSPLLERVKPMVRHLTTINFGRVTYEEEFRGAFREGGVELVELRTLGGTKHFSYRLAVARRNACECCAALEHGVALTTVSESTSTLVCQPVVSATPCSSAAQHSQAAEPPGTRRSPGPSPRLR